MFCIRIIRCGFLKVILARTEFNSGEAVAVRSLHSKYDARKIQAKTIINTSPTSNQKVNLH